MRLKAMFFLLTAVLLINITGCASENAFSSPVSQGDLQGLWTGETTDSTGGKIITEWGFDNGEYHALSYYPDSLMGTVEMGTYRINGRELYFTGDALPMEGSGGSGASYTADVSVNGGSLSIKSGGVSLVLIKKDHSGICPVCVAYVQESADVPVDIYAADTSITEPTDLFIPTDETANEPNEPKEQAETIIAEHANEKTEEELAESEITLSVRDLTGKWGADLSPYYEYNLMVEYNFNQDMTYTLSEYIPNSDGAYFEEGTYSVTGNTIMFNGQSTIWVDYGEWDIEVHVYPGEAFIEGDTLNLQKPTNEYILTRIPPGSDIIMADPELDAKLASATSWPQLEPGVYGGPIEIGVPVTGVIDKNKSVYRFTLSWEDMPTSDYFGLTLVLTANTYAPYEIRLAEIHPAAQAQGWPGGFDEWFQAGYYHPNAHSDGFRTTMIKYPGTKYVIDDFVWEFNTPEYQWGGNPDEEDFDSNLRIHFTFLLDTEADFTEYWSGFGYE